MITDVLTRVITDVGTDVGIDDFGIITRDEWFGTVIIFDLEIVTGNHVVGT